MDNSEIKYFNLLEIKKLTEMSTTEINTILTEKRKLFNLLMTEIEILQNQRIAIEEKEIKQFLDSAIETHENKSKGKMEAICSFQRKEMDKVKNVINNRKEAWKEDREFLKIREK